MRPQPNLIKRALRFMGLVGVLGIFLLVAALIWPQREPERCGMRDIASASDIPPEAFLFESDSARHDYMGRILQVPDGANVLVGADPSDNPIDTTYLKLQQTAHERGLKFHVYLQGPGGPTGNDWSDDEWRSVVNAAKAAGIQLDLAAGPKSPQNSLGMFKWNLWGWEHDMKTQLRHHLEKAREDGIAEGIYSIELDNLWRVPYIGQDDDGLWPKTYEGLDHEGQSWQWPIDDPNDRGIVKFLQRYETWQGALPAGLKLPKLVLKNLAGPDLHSVERALHRGKIKRETLADFHLAEYDSGVPSEQAAAAARMGIQNVITGYGEKDTHDYRIPVSNIHYRLIGQPRCADQKRETRPRHSGFDNRAEANVNVAMSRPPARR
jgi:hypothetical protein